MDATAFFKLHATAPWPDLKKLKATHVVSDRHTAAHPALSVTAGDVTSMIWLLSSYPVISSWKCCSVLHAGGCAVVATAMLWLHDPLSQVFRAPRPHRADVAGAPCAPRGMVAAAVAAAAAAVVAAFCAATLTGPGQLDNLRV